MLTCFIRYQIEPHAKEDFVAYAQGWNRVIPRNGADLIGYFAPHEGSSTVAYGLYSLPSLAEYEAYRARLAADAEAQNLFALARERRFLRSEDRLFLKRVAS